MPVVSPPAVNALPTPPSTASPGTFDVRADAFLGALPAMQSEYTALGANLFANATDAASSATIAATQATGASNSASSASASAINAANAFGASLWISATSYTLGQAATSSINYQVYRRIIDGSGGADPSLDAVNWVAAAPPATASNLFLHQNFGGF